MPKTRAGKKSKITKVAGLKIQQVPDDHTTVEILDESCAIFQFSSKAQVYCQMMGDRLLINIVSPDHQRMIIFPGSDASAIRIAVRP